ncbi:uncharacterized protein LOC126578135 [Anopheles aquasalis]|uniref:uncharacterized protein LOC126578135 n=1 Tax=Anopheles aquasalis TaxID=42839 RepID=UPI00215B6FD3|nr:uncharacterized protein LOC126578135 [Anopheles aquasalis]
MNRLVLAVGVFCLLQGVLANPRPDFGVQPTIPVSATVKVSFENAFAEVTDITDLPLNQTLVISNAKLQAVYIALKEILNQTTTLTSAFMYDELFTVDNGTTLAFANILQPIDDMVTYINITAETDIITPLNDSTSYFGILDELDDEFTRLALGLVDLKTELLAVKGNLDSAVSANSGSPAISVTQLATYLKSAAVYKLVRAINRVKAYLPVITYTLDTVYENLLTANAFIDDLQAAVSSVPSSNTTDYAAAYKISSDAVELEASTGIAANLNVTLNLNDTLGAITNFVATSNATTILTKLGELATKDTSLQASSLTSEFNNTLNDLKAFINSRVSSVNVTTDPRVQVLIDVLMGNNYGFGRYCYYKYKELFANLFDNGVDAGFECTDKEAERLKNLQDIITALLVQIAFDTEEIVAQINLCASLPSAQANACVAAVTGYYVDLFAATSQKIDALYTFVTKEAVASRNRLLICFQLVSFQQGDAEAGAIVNNVQICARDGPAGTLE